VVSTNITLCGMWGHVVWCIGTDVSGKPDVSVFRVEE
jgi:hypothetical protein